MLDHDAAKLLPFNIELIAHSKFGVLLVKVEEVGGVQGRLTRLIFHELAPSTTLHISDVDASLRAAQEGDTLESTWWSSASWISLFG